MRGFEPRFTYYGTLIALLLSVISLTTPAALAQDMSQEKMWCSGRDGASDDLKISSCTKLILSGTLTTPNLSAAFYNRGNVYSDKKDFDRAIQDLNEAIRLNPQYADAFSNRGNAYKDKKDFDRAIQDYNEAIRLNPQYAAAFNNRCWARALFGQLDAALADCNSSLRLRPNDAHSFDSRALVYLKSGRLADALADYNKSLELNSKNAFSLYGRGLVKQKKGDIAGAKLDIEAAKAIQADIADEFKDYGVQASPRTVDARRLREAIEEAQGRSPAARRAKLLWVFLAVLGLAGLLIALRVRRRRRSRRLTASPPPPVSGESLGKEQGYARSLGPGIGGGRALERTTAMTLQEYNEFLDNYYRVGLRGKLREALELASGVPVVATNNARYLALYAFARIGQLDPAALLEYESICSDSSNARHSPAARLLAETVLWLAREPRTGLPPEPLPAHFPLNLDILGRPARSAPDLDYLWTEFCVTGRREPVLRVAAVLHWPDRTRAKLEAWLATPVRGTFARWRRRRALLRLERIAGIRCDARAATILTAGDLDCLCVVGLYARIEHASRFPLVRSALPFPLAEADVTYMGVKGSARWSFLSFARKHQVVWEVWESEMLGEPLPPSLRPPSAAQVLSVDGERPTLAREPELAPRRPRRHVIMGVPFVAWADVGHWDYPDKNIINPSLVAATAMLNRYWGRPDFTEVGEERSIASFTIRTLDELKDVLSQDIPVFLAAGLTPAGHPTGTEMLTMFGGAPELVEFVRTIGPHSGVMGTILPYTAFAGAGLPVLLRESVFIACRVAVGYDDAASTIFLHDPSFGPAWEILQDDFEEMWRPFRDRDLVAGRPPDSEVWIERRKTEGPYPARSVEQRAAEHLAFGYAMACVGRTETARARYEAGLQLPDLPPSYRHLYLVEVALLTRDPDSAIGLLRKAVDLVPDHSPPLRCLADLYWRRHDRFEAIRTLARAVARETGKRQPPAWVPQEMLLYPRGGFFPPRAEFLGWARAWPIRLLVAFCAHVETD